MLRCQLSPLQLNEDAELDAAFERLKDEDELTRRRKEGEKRVEGLTTEQYKSLRIRCKTDLFFLCTVLGFNRLSTNLHGHVCAWMARTQNEQFREILLPRGHFKSTVVTIAHSIQIVLPDDSNLEPWPQSLGTNCRLLLAHETHGQSSRFLYAITSQFLGNPLLMALFPECVPNHRIQRINKQELELPRTERWPEPTIDTMGVGGKSQGRHYNYLKLDDLFGDKARDSAAERSTTIEWFDNIQSFFSYHSRDKFDLVGTRWSLDDLYAHVHKVYKNQIKRYIRPIEELVQNPVTHQVEKRIIFPEEFNFDQLEILKQNRKIWTAQYLNDPREGANEFDLSWQRFYGWTDSRTIQPYLKEKDSDEKWIPDGPAININELDKIILVDPAVTGDYGYIVTGTDWKKRNYVLRAIKKNWTPNAFMDWIFSEVMKWNPRLVGIESVLFSALYENWMIREQQIRGIRFKVEPLLTKKAEKKLRVSGLSNYFSAGEIFFHESQTDLIEEFGNFGSIEQYHLLDSLAYGPRNWRTPIPPHLRESFGAYKGPGGRDIVTGYSEI